MMIQPIINVKSREIDYKNRFNLACNPVTYINVKFENNLTKDTFQMSRNPSFGNNLTSLIPKDEIFALCDKALKKIEGDVDEEAIYKNIVELVDRVKELMYQEMPERSQIERNVFSSFRHEITNYLQVVRCIEALDPAENPQEKIKLVAGINDIKASAQLWRVLCEDGLKLTDFLYALKRLNKNYPIDWQDSGLIDGRKSITNNLQLYSLLSQPLLNAIKYGEGKPVKVVIEEVEKGGKKRLFASVINPETTPIPEAEIDKILEGRGHRAERTATIYGKGFGFTEMIRILKTTEHESDIPNLIERGREKGVCVRVPIIGIKE